MCINYLNIYAFNEAEKEILKHNENIISHKVKLTSKDIEIYFYLKDNKHEIGVVDLVKKCLVNDGYDINSKQMYSPRKKVDSDDFYKSDTFRGYGKYRVDTFSRSLSKLEKSGLVVKNKIDSVSFFKAKIYDK